MPKSIVIRFSDYNDQQTIQQHKEIISKQKKVYWGWWKKNVELFPRKELAELKEKCPVEIGIVNRLEKKCFVANCVEIVLAKGDLPIKSPDKALTPKYYNDKNFPVWLALSSINEISVADFENKFHSIPNGEPTLFIVTASEIKDTKFELIDFIKINGKSILHISDLHFGKDHNYKDGVSSGMATKTLIDTLKPILAKYKKNIGAVVASGDFITQANLDSNYNSFNDAIKFLNELGNFLSVEKDFFMIIPGNHDMPIEDNSSNFKSDNSYQTQYAKFRKDFLGIEESIDFAFYKGFTTNNGWNIIFSCFNSTRTRSELLSNYGYVGADQYEPILNKLIDIVVKKKRISRVNAKKQSKLLMHHIINFCVIHHHLKFFMEPQEPRKKDNSISVLLDAGKLEEDLIKSGIHFLLHGHQHLPYVGSSGIFINDQRRNLNILSAGSAGAVISRGYLDLFPYNSFSIYTPTDDGLEVIIEKYNKNGNQGTLKKFVPYL